MYFLCTLQPELPETSREGYIGEWMTRQEKKEAILKFYKRKQHIPLSINHTTSKEYGSAIPAHERIGRVIDLFNDRDGDLIAKCVIEDKEAIHKLTNGTYMKGEKWGVSVRIDWCLPFGVSGGRIDKLLTHVALTTRPYLAEEGSYIHHWSTNEKAVDTVIVREYFKENDGHCFAAPELLCKIVNQSSNTPVSVATTTATAAAALTKTKVDTPGRHCTMSNEFAPSATTATEVQQQQSPQQEQLAPQQKNQQEQVHTDVSQRNTANTTPINRDSTKLVDMQAQLQEMELLLTNETPLQKMPPSFQMNYFNMLQKIEAKKNEIKGHVDYLVENKLLSKEDATPFLQGIDSTDLESKRPVYGYIEASYDDRIRTASASTALMRQMEENNKRVLAEKDNELESLKKKLRTSEYLAPVIPQRQQYEEFVSTSSSSASSAPLTSSTISLLRMDEKRGNDVIARETITNANMRAMFNYDIDRQTTVDTNGRERYAKLVNFMNKLNA